MTEAERFVKSVYPHAQCILGDNAFIWISWGLRSMHTRDTSKISQERAWELMQKEIERQMISALEE